MGASGAAWAAVTVDCVQPERVSAFWSRLLDAPARTIGLPGWFRIGPTAPGGPAITFQPVPEEKVGKSRIHLDLWVDELDAAVALVRELGGSFTNEIHSYDEGTVYVMSDVEGNEFCLVGPPAEEHEILYREGEAGSAYAGEVNPPDEAKRKTLSSLRRRIARAADRAAESLDLDADSALQASQATLEWSIRHRGPDSSMAIKAKSEVAHQLERSGRYGEAVEFRAEVVAQLQLLLGKEDPSTLAAEGFQAIDLDRLGRHVEARHLFEHVLAGRTEALGPDDPLTLLAMEWLGCSLRGVGEFGESLRLLQGVVDRYEHLGAGQTEGCLKARSHLATTQWEMGRFTEACEQRRQIVSVRTSTLGPDDPSTLHALEYLASTLQWLDESDEAILIYRSLLAKRARVLGMNDPETARTRELLAALEKGGESGP